MLLLEVTKIAEIRLPSEGIFQVLNLVAPGTLLREGLENVLRAKTGALIVIGEPEDVMPLVDGGFRLDTEFTPASLYELAKMDGAIILSPDTRRILYANAMLMPDPGIPSTETGIRHRTAERVARATGLLTISISQRRNIITLYKGSVKYPLKDIGFILTKANQAIQTLDKYQSVFNHALSNLGVLEFEEMVNLSDVTTVLQRFEMVTRIVKEITKYIVELGSEGRLIKMQLEELIADTDEDGQLVVKDYLVAGDNRSIEGVLSDMAALSSEELLDLTNFSKILGYSGAVSALEQPLISRGHRLLNKIPRLPMLIVENLVAAFGSLQSIVAASLEELDEVEGIGEARARTIKEGLRRLQQQMIIDRQRFI
ncbi:MAG: DNA integrity scanning protein DisA [Firmicutes bacterium]|nr:DNA integrity scanning protein DisA [Bacillota bacterium]